ncbi:Hydroxypyruvate isomerase [Rubripirellula reticaptiva]|uniref:Hydroxypyruvate isomerase n=2 Tax=Rubripirellula reticaptiva TaxID=2528013 RepID=A0A5C6EQE4_9BACT|nr:Hydroxypyruvate isomerase [Rubripirellula reticaptiva]
MSMNAPKFRPSVCIDAVFGTLDSAAAIKQVAAAGIQAIEFWGWWDKDLDAIEAARDEHEMQISACCTKFISLVDPATREDYLAGLAESIEAARRLSCPTLISQVGDFRPGANRKAQHDCLVIGLKQAAKLLAGSGVTLVIEPLNELVDHQGYYLVKSDEAFEVIDQVESEDVKVVFDIYHQQISEGQVITNLRNNIDKIGHFHAAGNPGRNELTIGELNYPQIFDAIADTKYEGFVGLEYWPTGDAVNGLREVAGWFGQ